MTNAPMHRRSRIAGIIDSRAVGFNPKSISNLQFWLKADGVTGYEDGNGLTPLINYSDTAGLNAISNVAVKSYKAIKNGLPIYRASNSSYSVPFALSSGSFTLVFAFNPSGTGASQYLMDSETGRLIITHTISGGTNVGWFDGSWHSIAAASAGWQILTFVLTSGGNGEIFRNGTSLGTAAYTAKALGGATRYFSSYDGNGAQVGGDFGEVLLYNKALSAGERAQVEGYLNAKWGIY